MSAASIVAKETRDARLDSWVFPEQVRQQALGTPALASAALATSGLSPAATGTKGAAASNVSAFSFSTQFGYVGVVVFSPIDNVPWVVIGVLHVLQSLWTSFFWACSVHFILVCLLSKTIVAHRDWALSLLTHLSHTVRAIRAMSAPSRGCWPTWTRFLGSPQLCASRGQRARNS